MERLLINQLMLWQKKADRKPLIVRGARQVGKTWLLKDFGRRCFKHVCYINFEQKDVLTHVFANELIPEKIIDQLSIYCGKRISAQDTLIIFDEVQEMPRALTSLKYFAEEAPQYAICCAGSLLGVALHEGTSFPVGKVDFIDLYPMSFHEFLLANGETMLVDYIMRGERYLAPFDNRLTELLKQYLIVGGMPSAVNKWIETHDVYTVDNEQHNLIAAYENDFSKHAPKNMVEKIRYIWESIPSQLAKENRKFIYGLVREGARAREYEDALMWLNDAGEIIRTYNVSKPDVPLRAYADLKSFKVFLLDVGLLRCMSGLSPRVILEGSRIFGEFKGAITEQYVCQELQTIPHLQGNFYWTSQSKAEIDFLLTDGLQVIPLECKAGYTMNAKSMKSYREKYKPSLSIRTSLLPYERQESGIINIPLYLLFAIKDEIRDYFSPQGNT